MKYVCVPLAALVLVLGIHAIARPEPPSLGERLSALEGRVAKIETVLGLAVPREAEGAEPSAAGVAWQVSPQSQEKWGLRFTVTSASLEEESLSVHLRILNLSDSKLRRAAWGGAPFRAHDGLGNEYRVRVQGAPTDEGIYPNKTVELTFTVQRPVPRATNVVLGIAGWVFSGDAPAEERGDLEFTISAP